MRMTPEGSAHPLTEEDLRAFENRLGAALPDEYRAFLGQHNGGSPLDAYFQYCTSKGELQYSRIECFYAVTPQGMLWTDIEWRTPRWDERPTGALAIADAIGGSEFLLFVSGHRTGQVWFKDYDSCAGYDNPEEELHFFARNFTEFLQMLRPYDEKCGRATGDS